MYHRVRTPLTPRIAVSCICIAIIAVYLLFLPPLLLSGSPDDCCRCPCDRLRRRRPYPLLSSFQASSAPSPLPDTAYLIYILSVALGIAAAMLLPIQLHSLFLSPFEIPAFILCSLFYLCNFQQLALRIV